MALRPFILSLCFCWIALGESGPRAASALAPEPASDPISRWGDTAPIQLGATVTPWLQIVAEGQEVGRRGDHTPWGLPVRRKLLIFRDMRQVNKGILLTLRQPGAQFDGVVTDVGAVLVSARKTTASGGDRIRAPVPRTLLEAGRQRWNVVPIRDVDSDV